MVDYSKWKDIEISDDEDETHPNIDTPSLFRWRHHARLERMEQLQKEKAELTELKEKHAKKYKEIKEKFANEQSEDLKKQLEELEKEKEEIRKKEEEIQKKEQSTPWNVDTISQPGFTKTIVNKPKPRAEEKLSEEEREKRTKQFIKENESLMKQYGMLQRYDDSKRFLTEHPHLVCEDTPHYLVIWCINLELEEKHNLMKHVAHQCICMQYILELGRELDCDPRSCISGFFTRIQTADPEYKESFDQEVAAFIDRITKRAQEKLDAALKEAEEEERKQRLGPGGLDPVEVFESLPECLKKCFETKDIQMLQETITKMARDEAEYHIKRCIDSGLWIPDAKKQET